MTGKPFVRRHAIPCAFMDLVVWVCILFLGFTLIFLGCGKSEKGGKEPEIAKHQPAQAESEAGSPATNAGEGIVPGTPDGTASEDIRDIKPIEPMGTTPALLYILIGLAVCALILGWILLRHFLRSKRKKETPILPSPDKVALRELERLKASHYLDRNDFRSFYFELSGILRGYMEKRFGFPAQESTTEELIPRIEATALTRKQKDTVRVLSSGEDLVKFARHTPTREKAIEDWEETRRFILETIVKPEPAGGDA